ncbi:MAG: hypothetical protein EBR82_55315, partial [Caulobacteraceae bacterium]|nr:hypothetical protein [Caulobacteraceae bacterium]
TPNLENIINQSPTEMLGVNTDPRLRDAELAALGSTGGASLAAQMLNQQAGSEQRHMDALNLGGRAQDVALRAIMDSGEIGSRVRGEDFNEQAQKARAQDTINAMNAQAARGTQQRNVASMNDAQQSNLGEAQRIYDSNINTRNQQALYNAKVPQQMFDNAMTKQGAIAGARQGQVANAQQSGQQQANMWSGIGQGFAGLGSSISDNLYKNERANQITSAMKKKPSDGYYGDPRFLHPELEK